MMKNINYLIISILSAFLINFFSLSNTNVQAEDNYKTTDYSIVVDLNGSSLFLFNNATKKIDKEYKIAGGKPSTPSPLGTWEITEKEKNWGKGFGTRWMALNVPWGKYGIHGTNKPLSIGGSASLGCIRMHNNDVEDLYNLVSVGTIVIIYGGAYNCEYNTFRFLQPGDRGSDVLEVQRKLKDAGYYNGTLDGIYGITLKNDVIKFRYDHKLPNTHNIDKTLYKALGMLPFD